MRSSLVAVGLTVVVGLLASASGWGGFPSTDVYLASVGGGPGDAGSRWYTTVWVHNPTANVANVQLTFLVRDQANPAPTGVFDDAVSPGDTRRYDNAVQDLFGLTEAFGAIRVTSTESLLVTSRIYTLPAGGEDRDSTGQLFTATPASFAIGAGQSTELLGVYQTQPADDSQFRYNFGFVETTGGNATVRVSAFDETAAPLAENDYVLGPYEVRQYSIASQFPHLSSTNVRLAVAVLSGSGKVIAFGSGLANRSNDPSTFEMSFDEGLLGGAGSITGVTAGQGLVGGGTTGTVVLDVAAGPGIDVQADAVGIADQGVTSAMIADGAVTRDDLADDAVTTTKIADGSILTADLADDAVRSNKIKDGQVLSADLADDAVTSTKIQDGQVAAADLAAGAVGNTALADGAVTGGKVSVPLTLTAAATRALELANDSNGGLAGATLHAVNSSTGSGIAGFFETAGSDATLVVMGNGSGELFKGFGSDGGNSEIRIENNGTVKLYDTAHANTVTLDASTGRGTFGDLRLEGHSNASLPIAYAYVEFNGTKRSGTGNVSTSYDAVAKWYVITITGESYYYRDYTTVVTPMGSSPAVAVTNQNGTDLVVIVYNLNGDRISSDFQFVTFKGP